VLLIRITPVFKFCQGIFREFFRPYVLTRSIREKKAKSGRKKVLSGSLEKSGKTPYA
jgi:hypothetical protein